MRRVSLFAVALVALVVLGAGGASAQSSAWGSTNGVVVFRSDRDGEPDVFTLDPSTSSVTNLTSGSGAAELQPAWSPEGERIAYVRRAGIAGRADLFVMNPSGGGRTRLTSTPVPERDPSWSPDGTRLVFERCCENGTSDLFTIDVATRAEVNLTPSSTQQDFDPVWSPDGTRIAFVSFEVGQGNLDVWVMNADGTAPMRLTQEAGPDLAPDWQPIPA